ncbi:MAG TPA: manganese-binding transcriptional regulator MntR [Geminicoccaceae bacterium]|nr:manganese-binding transcriptional regulator MntR [Geminicoccaceae bacterium]
MTPSAARSRAASPRKPDPPKPPGPPGSQAEGFRRTRAAHRSETAEDYVELIAELIGARGEARAVDIAACLGISQATVANTVARLRREGLVEHRPYRSVFLTDAGRELAEAARRRHRLVVAFLRALGLSEGTAARDAEGIEHHVSDETLEAFARFVEAKGG